MADVKVTLLDVDSSDVKMIEDYLQEQGVNYSLGEVR